MKRRGKLIIPIAVRRDDHQKHPDDARCGQDECCGECHRRDADPQGDAAPEPKTRREITD